MHLFAQVQLAPASNECMKLPCTIHYLATVKVTYR